MLSAEQPTTSSPAAAGRRRSSVNPAAMPVPAVGSFGAFNDRVSSLKALRMEEAAFREMRSQRRAILLLDQQSAMVAEADAQRRRVDCDKLILPSGPEFDVLKLLEEQCRWRHVIAENVEHRSGQMDKLVKHRDAHHNVELDMLAKREDEKATEDVRDDTERWGQLVERRAKERSVKHHNLAAEIVDGVVDLAIKTVDFVEQFDCRHVGPAEMPVIERSMTANELKSEGSVVTAGSARGTVERVNWAEADKMVCGKPETMVESVPQALFAHWKLSWVYRGDEEAVKNHILRKHVTEQGCFCANQQLSDLQSIMVRLLHPDAPPARPKKPLPFPVLAFAGPKYSGKSFLAQRVSERMKLVYVNDIVLVQQAMDALDREFTIAEVEDDNAVELLQLGKECRAVLQTGEPVPDDLLVRLAVFHIMQQQQQCNENDVTDGAVDGEAGEVTRMNESSNAANVDQTLPHEAEGATVGDAGDDGGDSAPGAATPSGCFGVVLDGVLANRESAILLEQHLSGYKYDRKAVLPDQLLAPLPMYPPALDDPLILGDGPPPQPPGTQELRPEPSTNKKAESKPAAKKDKKKGDVEEEPLPPADLPPVDEVPPLTEEEQRIIHQLETEYDVASLNAVVHFDCPSEVIFERFAGLRRDRETGKVYHTTLDPPPKERLPFLDSVDRVSGTTAQVQTALKTHQRNWKHLSNWVTKTFNNDANGGGLLRIVDGTLKPDEVEGNVVEICEEAQQKAAVQYEALTSYNTIMETRKNLQERYEQQVNERETARKQLLKLYQDRQVDPMPPELLKSVAVADTTVKVHPAAPPIWEATLNNFTEHYSTTMNQLLATTRTSIQLVYDQGKCCSFRYNEHWSQPDVKTRLLSQFIQEFNTFAPIVRQDDQGKEELHLRTDAIQEALWNACDKRKEEGLQLIESLLATNNFIDQWVDCIRCVAVIAIQLEVERFLLVKHLAMSFHAIMREEPVPIDEAEMCLDIAVLPKTANPNEEQVNAAPAKGKEAKKAAPKKGGAKEEAEDENKSDDPIIMTAERAMQALTSFEKTAVAPPATTTQGKGDKKGKNDKNDTHESPQTIAAAAAQSLVSAEAGLTRVRVKELVAQMEGVIAMGKFKYASTRNLLSTFLRDRFKQEVAAVNAVEQHIRRCIEEEKPIQHNVMISGSEVTIDTGAVIVPTTVVPSVPEAEDNSADTRMLTSYATTDHLLSLIKLFRTIAPNFVVRKEQFLRVVFGDEWGYANEKSGIPSPEELFDRFDHCGGEAIDWRAVIVHILLWSEPETTEDTTMSAFGDSRNQNFIDGPSLMHLFDMKSDLLAACAPESDTPESSRSGSPVGFETYAVGDSESDASEPPIEFAKYTTVTKERFLETRFFFDHKMDLYRCETLKTLLWETFHDPATQELDVTVLLLFLCADDQPLRGVQKAFAMASAPNDDSCSLTSELVYSTFHYLSATPGMVGKYDPWGRQDVEALFQSVGGGTEGPEGQMCISFQEACATHVGRALLNNTVMFKKVSFGAVDEEDEAGEDIFNSSDYW